MSSWGVFKGAMSNELVTILGNTKNESEREEQLIAHSYL